MKKIFLLALAAVAFCATACSEKLLDEPQKGAVTTDEFYVGDEACEGALAAMYAAFLTSDTDHNNGGTDFFRLGMLVEGMMGDDFVYCDDAGRNIGDARWNYYDLLPTDNGDVQGHFANFYVIISRANYVIEYFDGVEGESDYMKMAVAEAKTVRAYCYIRLPLGQPSSRDEKR